MRKLTDKTRKAPDSYLLALKCQAGLDREVVEELSALPKLDAMFVAVKVVVDLNQRGHSPERFLAEVVSAHQRGLKERLSTWWPCTGLRGAVMETRIKTPRWPTCSGRFFPSV